MGEVENCEQAEGPPPARFKRSVFYGKAQSLLFDNVDALRLCRGRDAWIGHHVVDCVTRLGDDHLQVHGRLAAVRNRKSSSAVRVHRVGAGVRGPARRHVAVDGDRVELGQIPFAIKRGLGEAIHEECRSVRVDDLPVNGKGIGALDRGIAASAGVGHQG
jgi:hypothetical protein